MPMNSKITTRLFSIALCLIFSSNLYCRQMPQQHTEDPSKYSPDTVAVCDEKIENVLHLHPFFEKLLRLENTKEGKINIVHIGDSHVQANLFTHAVRQPLQDRFGNAGRGFIFPYGMKGTGTNPFHRFVSDAAWQVCRNNQQARCASGTEFGLGGYGLNTDAEQFTAALEIHAPQYYFNTIKVVTSSTPSIFRLAKANENPLTQIIESFVEEHRVRRGETLNAIARKYEVTAASIWEENSMDTMSNNLRPGTILRIPVTTVENIMDTSKLHPLEYQSRERFTSTYHQEEPLSAIYLLPAGKRTRYNLNGIVIENDAPGIIYHNVGAIGSQASHFNATPLFFDQLPILSADLVVVSFGTNESYAGLPAARFIAQLDLLIQNIRKAVPNTPILVTTPPTSLLPEERLNEPVAEYVEHLMQKTDVALWDLYAFTGGLEGARDPERIQLSSDNVHYMPQGYESQGRAFACAILNEYENYKSNRF